ncbi:unnamed protein product [Parnassius apollo]|uniref:(apollo) hypothetical protein n=1 Tax=Parnassius apollo TaxID=110799 RepID=A0A8S3Y416_PARAO|nr:unnamed protein product [Parnassius apollo]CAG5052798.1 unnamed protein product [Parnassius apollo]
MSTSSKKAFKCDTCLRASTSKLQQIPDKVRIENVNITKRKKINKNISLQSLSDHLSDGEETDYSSINSTPNHQLNRRLSLHMQCYDEISELKQKILKLEENLEIAENEITNLSSENHNLKKKVAEYELKVNQLKHICKSTPSSSSKSTKKKKKKVKKIDFNISLKESENQNPPHIHLAPSSCPLTQLDGSTSTENFNTCVTVGTSQEGATPKKQEVDNLNRKKNRIFILGDDQLRGLSSALTMSRCGKWNNTYKIYGHIMPGATSEEILRNCDHSLLNELTENDFVIVGIGSNDKDLHRLHSDICILINKLSKATILNKLLKPSTTTLLNQQISIISVISAKTLIV